MPSVLPTIPNNPPQGIQALLDKVYLWNPDVSNELIGKINALLTKLGDAIGAIRPYNEMVAPINQYEPCYYGDGVYVAKNYLAGRAEEFNEEDWILIARKEITADKVPVNFAGQEDTVQNAIDTLKTDQGKLGDQVSTIESKIPADASETNQLVTKNEVLALPTFTYTVVNELPETGEEKILYLVPKAGEGNDVHDEYIWVNGAYELIGTTAVDLIGYLPLSGGTMAGDILMEADTTYSTRRIKFEVPRHSGDSKYKYELAHDAGGTKHGFGIFVKEGNNINSCRYCFTVDSFCTLNSGTQIYNLGNSDNPWRTIYVTKMNNGADIAVPTEGGTLARIEDIDAAVGDISTALTAILGE